MSKDTIEFKISVREGDTENVLVTKLKNNTEMENDDFALQIFNNTIKSMKPIVDAEPEGCILQAIFH